MSLNGTIKMLKGFFNISKIPLSDPDLKTIGTQHLESGISLQTKEKNPNRSRRI